MSKEDNLYCEKRKTSQQQDWLSKKEEKSKGFKCVHCELWVPINETMVVKNRNHCQSCLWSKHVDYALAGDRKAECQQGMEPIGLSIKDKGYDKYGKQRQGELMLIHKCHSCDKISINRIAADDNENNILDVFNKSLSLSKGHIESFKKDNIKVLTQDDLPRINKLLFGKIV